MFRRTVAAFNLALVVCATNSLAGDDETFQYTGFQSPTHNIGCTAVVRNTRAESVDCFIYEVMQSAPCSGEERAFRIGATDNSGEDFCVTDSYGPVPRPVLGYGSTWEMDGLKCEIEKTGVTCKNLRGHGFSLSRKAQRVF